MDEQGVDVRVRIKHGLFKKRFICYRCEVCAMDLESPESDAGKDDRCPRCNSEFVVPGSEELVADQTAELLKLAQERKSQHQHEEERKKSKYLAEAEKAMRRPMAKVPDLVWTGNMSCHSCGHAWRSRRPTPPSTCPSCKKRHNVHVVMAYEEEKHGGLVLRLCIIVIVALAFFVISALSKSHVR